MNPGSNRDMPELIDFLKTNGYDLEDVKYSRKLPDDATVIFSKMTHINDRGNDINDAMITISIKFDRRFDYKNIAWMEEEDHDQEEILEKSSVFIGKLIDGTYGDGNGMGKGMGKGKNKSKRRRTLKNRKH